MWDPWLDLVLGSACASCSRPGRALCLGCRDALRRHPFETRPDPCPEGLLPVHAGGDYAGGLRAVVIAHKERRRFALAGPLGEVLCSAVLDLLSRPGDPPDDREAAEEEVVLVPVPSRRTVTAARGHDPLLRVARVAAVQLRRRGMPARVLPTLRQVSRPLDQAGLSADERAINLAGRFAQRASWQRTRPLARIVLVDDVVTTGATLREAQRALEDAGWPLAGAGVVAATRRRRPGRPVTAVAEAPKRRGGPATPPRLPVPPPAR